MFVVVNVVNYSVYKVFNQMMVHCNIGCIISIKEITFTWLLLNGYYFEKKQY